MPFSLKEAKMGIKTLVNTLGAEDKPNGKTFELKVATHHGHLVQNQDVYYWHGTFSITRFRIAF